jgi:RNase P/RNase MRP subunit p30
MSQLIDALSHVLRDRLAEIDREIIRSQSEREVALLWRLHTGLRKLLRALVGHEAK